MEVDVITYGMTKKIRICTPKSNRVIQSKLKAKGKKTSMLKMILQKIVQEKLTCQARFYFECSLCETAFV